MIERDITPHMRKLAREFPVLTLTGPRQSGKSTLCRALFSGHSYVNMEAPDVRSFALNDPRAFLAQFRGGAVIDEIQRCPNLLSYLQVLVDEDPRPGRWILTGSQNLALLESVSQSLAGRTAILNLLPLDRHEVSLFARHPASANDALLTGGYPRILDRRIGPADWLGSYVATYIERDVRNVSKVGDLTVFQRFLELCAGRTAQLLNFSSLAGDCGISQPTATAWLSILETTFILFRLPAYSRNVTSRLVKMPKLHFYDSGLVCWLLGIRDGNQLQSHPLRGAIFESWVVSEIVKHRANRGETKGLFHYRDNHGVETDLIVSTAGGPCLVEVKASATPPDGVLSSLQKVSAIVGKGGEKPELVIAYAGDAIQRRSDFTLLPWNRLHERQWC